MVEQNRKKIVNNSVMLFIRTGITVIVSLFTSRIVLQQLGVSDYGVYNVVGGFVSLMAFIQTSFVHGIQRFINFFKAKEDKDAVIEVFSASLLILFILSVVILLFGETVGMWFLKNYFNIPHQSMLDAHWVFQFSLLASIISLFQTPFTSTIIANEDMQVYAYISIVEVAMKLMIAYSLCLATNNRLTLYASLICGSSMFVLLCYIIYCRHKYRTCQIKRVSNAKIYKDLLSFSGWSFVGSSANIISVQGVNIILNIFFGTVVNAARGIAVQISSQLDNLINNIQIAMNPQLIQLYSTGQISQMRELLNDNFKWNFFMMWIAGFPILLNTKDVLWFWLGEVPEYTVVFTQLVIFRCFLKVFERPLITSQMAHGKMKFPSMITGGFLIVEVILAWILFRNGYPPYWAFILDLLAIVACIIYDAVYMRIRGVFSIRLVVRGVLLPCLMIILLCMVAGTGVSYTLIGQSFWIFAARLIIDLIIAALSIWFIGLSKCQRQILIAQLVKRLHPNDCK